MGQILMQSSYSALLDSYCVHSISRLKFVSGQRYMQSMLLTGKWRQVKFDHWCWRDWWRATCWWVRSLCTLADCNQGKNEYSVIQLSVAVNESNHFKGN